MKAPQDPEYAERERKKVQKQTGRPDKIPTTQKENGIKTQKLRKKPELIRFSALLKRKEMLKHILLLERMKPFGRLKELEKRN